MNITRIFLDMDDVCNRFTMYALRLAGCLVDIFDDSVFDPKWKFDIIKALNALHPTQTFTAKSFWDNLPEEAWSLAPISDEYHYLLDWATEIVGRSNMFFLTSPTLCPLSCSGKLKWIKYHAPPWMQRQYVITPRKICCANEYSLLIDDKDSNVVDFKAAGGHAVLVPRPWNSAHDISKGGDRIAYLKHRLQLIQRGSSWR